MSKRTAILLLAALWGGSHAFGQVFETYRPDGSLYSVSEYIPGRGFREETTSGKVLYYVPTHEQNTFKRYSIGNFGQEVFEGMSVPMGGKKRLETNSQGTPVRSTEEIEGVLITNELDLGTPSQEETIYDAYGIPLNGSEDDSWN